ncbi:hypothetical protein ACFL50_07160 [Candidatus Latescibacterota bacterium]
MLLSTRKPGIWATLPRIKGSGCIEPLFAYYDFRSHQLLETCAANGIFRPSHILENEKAITVSPPEDLAPAWNNINTKEKQISRRNTNKNQLNRN